MYGYYAVGVRQGCQPITHRLKPGCPPVNEMDRSLKTILSAQKQPGLAFVGGQYENNILGGQNRQKPLQRML